jgi:hypothetical protein
VLVFNPVADDDEIIAEVVLLATEAEALLVAEVEALLAAEVEALPATEAEEETRALVCGERALNTNSRCDPL